MNMFLIIGRDGGLEISHEELVAALQQAADECQCPACTERHDGEASDELLPADVLTDTYRAPGQGGWSQATPGVQLTHKPTGITVTCDTERSAYANKSMAWEQLTAAVKQFNDRRTELKSLLTPQGGTAFDIEGEVGVELAPDQFAYVDSKSGTAYFENINDPDSRVRSELISRGWAPPGEGVSIQYPDVMRARPGESQVASWWRAGWNDCRVNTMTMNRADRNGNRR